MNKDIQTAFNTLANIAGGYIQNDNFIQTNSTKIEKIKHNSKELNFYCITVPSGSFVVKYNDKISITGNCHSEAGAWLFRTLLKEAIDDNAITTNELKQLQQELEETTNIILEHEVIIISKIFEKGTIKGITETQLKSFIESRLDICLENLGYNSKFNPHYNPIAKWIYKDITSSILHDFFNSVGNDYHRSWNELNFKW